MDPEEDDIPVDDEFGAPLDDEFGSAEPPVQQDSTGRRRVRVHGLQFDPIEIEGSASGQELPLPEVAEPHEADFEVYSKEDPRTFQMMREEDPEAYGQLMSDLGEEEATRALDTEYAHARPTIQQMDANSHAQGYPGGFTDLTDFAHQVQRTPTAPLMGAAQGLTSEWGDELYGAMTEAAALDPSLGAGGFPYSPPPTTTPEGAHQLGEDATADYRALLEESEREAPGPTALGRIGGAGAQMAVLPIPGTQGLSLPWRFGQGLAIGGTAGAVAGAGAADEGDRLTGAAEGAEAALPYALGGTMAAEALGGLGRVPGAVRGASEDLERHGAQMRLRSSGMTGPGAMQAADQAYGGPQRGRLELARTMRERGLGETAGIPNPRATLEHSVELAREVGPQIGNPLRGPEHLGELERTLDEAGAYVNMTQAADELERAAAHERGLIGSGSDAVVEQLVRPMREMGPVRFSRAHAQRQAFQQRDFPGVPPQYLQRAEEILDEHLARAARSVDATRADAAGRVFDTTGAPRLDRVTDAALSDLAGTGSVPYSRAQAYLNAIRRQAASRRRDAASAGRRAREVGGDTGGASPARIAQVRRVAQQRAARYLEEAQALDAQASRVEAWLAEQTPQVEEGSLSGQWGDLNRDYSLARFLLQHARGGDRASQQSPMVMGEAAAMRQMLGGDPSALAQLEIGRQMGGLGRTLGQGVYTRAVEGLSSGGMATADALQRLVGEAPERLGPYLDEIRTAAAAGPGQLAAYHYQQAMSDPEYREMLQELGLSWDDAQEDLPQIYDEMTDGLTAEDL